MANKVTVEEWVARFRAIGLDEDQLRALARRPPEEG